MTCGHDKAKWAVFDPDGGVVALDDNGEDVTHHTTVEWCSECGCVKIGPEWISPGHSEPPWLSTIRALAGISGEIEQWTKEGTNHLSTKQVDDLALAVDHVNRARGFLDRAFGVLPGDTVRPPAQGAE